MLDEPGNVAEAATTTDDRLDPDFMEDYVLYMMALASHHMSAEFHAIVRAEGLRVPEWRILATLASYEPQSVTQLCEKTLYDQPRLTKTLHKMEAADLVTRRQQAHDRRVVHATLTPRGRAVVQDLIALARDHEIRALSALSSAERRQLKRLLRKLI
ncbi:MAG: MarR family winged helix-turn-helix transcriptional regulator [Pseudomonadota bacterium]